MTKRKSTKNTSKIHPLLAILVMTIVAILIFIAFNKLQNSQFQSGLSNFYNTSDIPKNGPLGEVIRSEDVNTNLANGSAHRIIYRSQDKDGKITFSSGMIYIPNKAASSPRPIVAWAHGTIGMGDSCAPSRQKVPVVENSINWVDAMLQKGWIVTATDYSGLGTPGVEPYLVGQGEANDVLNSVRAAKNFPGSDAGNQFAIWGHSQGGHSALFSSSRVKSYLPEYKLVGTVASAPAAELESLFSQQQNSAVAWIIGPEVGVSWPSNYEGLDLASVFTKAGYNNFKGIAEKCINQAAIDGLIRERLGQKFFNDGIATNSVWQSILADQTAPVLSPSQPLMVAESLTDNVVLPNTTAKYIQRACSSGSNLTQLWLTNVGHIQLQSVISPTVINWINDRFNSRPALSNCNQPLPIAPAQ